MKHIYLCQDSISDHLFSPFHPSIYLYLSLSAYMFMCEKIHKECVPEQALPAL